MAFKITEIMLVKTKDGLIRFESSVRPLTATDLRKIADLLDAYNAKRKKLGKDLGGKGTT